jgi:hypothetical protein
MWGLGSRVLDVGFKLLALDFGLEGLGFRFRVYIITLQNYCLK